ncbi:hypothetical protein HDU96_000759 [Phlyctochytrium bullatum]|nr:hypothetical protein HDU96_000759 [Phlyctochytrium bullatum]
MRILEVQGNSVQLGPFADYTVRSAIEKGHEEMLLFLLWIGRKGVEDNTNGHIVDGESGSVVVAPWLQYVRTKLEVSSRRPSPSHNTLRITLPGISASAHTAAKINIDAVNLSRKLIREAHSNFDNTLTILNLIAHAAGGWHVLSNHNGTNMLIAHHDIRIEGSDHVLHGLEDLLFFGCKNGKPATAKFLIDKIRNMYRMEPARARDGDTASNQIAHFITSLSECLEAACSRENEDEVLEICRCLLYESQEDEILAFEGNANNRSLLVASLSLRHGKALSDAAARGMVLVTDLLLSQPSLPAAALYPALVKACFAGHETIISRILTRTDVDLPAAPRRVFFYERKGIDHIWMNRIIAEANQSGDNGDVAFKLGHPPVSLAIAFGYNGVLKLLLADRRVDAGGGMTALRLACASGSPEMVLEVLSVDRYVKVFRAVGVGDTPTPSGPNPELVQLVTKFVLDMVARLGHLDMEEESIHFGKFKRFLLTGLPDLVTLKDALAEKLIGREWMDALDLFLGGYQLAAK